MILFIMLFIILCLSFGIKTSLKIKQEEALVIAVFGMVIITYSLGLLELLWISAYFIGVLVLISLIYVISKIVKKEEKIKELVTLPTIIYVIVMCFIYYNVKDAKFVYYDEFMFWGTNLKTMIYKSCLWASSQVEGIHQIYPPFTAIAEYIFCMFNGEFNEGITYWGLITLMFTAIMPLFKNEKYSIKSLFKLIAIISITYFSITFFTYKITNLSVDCILGVILGVLMYLVYESKEQKDYLVITILLISLTLIKTNGILLAGIAIMQLFLKKLIILIQQKDKRKNIIMHFSIVGILLIVIILTNLIWHLYCTVNGKQLDDRHDKNSLQSINIKEFIDAITLKEDGDIRNKSIVKEFIDELLNTPITVKKYFNTTIIIFIVINCLFIEFTALKKDKNNAIANLLSINIGFVLYMISNLIVFMFVFQKEQGEMLMGFTRYTQTYMLAMTLNLIYCILENINLKTIIIACLSIVLLQNGLGNEEVAVTPINETSINEITIQNANDIISNVKETDKVYIIDQKLDAGYEFMVTKFLITPIETNLLYEWNIGNTTEGIFYKIALSEEEFVKKLIDEKYDYIYVISIKGSFLKEYQNIFTEDAKEKLKQIVDKDYITNGILLNVNNDIIK